MHELKGEGRFLLTEFENTLVVEMPKMKNDLESTHKLLKNHN